MGKDGKKNRSWHKKHIENLTLGQKISDRVAYGMGSWKFIIFQTIFVFVWMAMNVVGMMYHWDAYPFILLNLLFSTQAAYAAPIIMMSQNRQSERDRIHAEEDFVTNVKAKKEIEDVKGAISRIENHRLREIAESLQELKAIVSRMEQKESSTAARMPQEIEKG